MSLHFGVGDMRGARIPSVHLGETVLGQMMGQAMDDRLTLILRMNDPYADVEYQLDELDALAGEIDAIASYNKDMHAREVALAMKEVVVSSSRQRVGVYVYSD